MAQDGSRWLLRCPKRPQDRPKTAPRSLRASPGGRQEAKILQKPKENQCFWASPLFASDGLLRPQGGSKMAQEGPKRGWRICFSALEHDVLHRFSRGIAGCMRRESLANGDELPTHMTNTCNIDVFPHSRVRLSNAVEPPSSCP